MIKISIIVPIHKVQLDYLKTCIESLLKQTLKDIEILLVFNGETDQQVQFCKDRYGNLSCVRMFVLEEPGVSRARNYGIKKALGRYVMFCDSDDWLADDACEKLYNQIEKDCSDMLIYNYICVVKGTNRYNHLYKKSFTREGKEIEKFYYSNICKKLDTDLNGNVQKGIGGSWNRIYKKEMLVENDVFFSEKCEISEDIIFTLYAAAASVKVSYVPFDGYFYRIHEHSATSKYDSSIFEKNMPYFKELALFFERNSISCTEEKEDIINLVIVNSYIRAAEQIWTGTRRDRNLREKGIALYKKKLNEAPYAEALQKAKLSLFSNRQRAAVIILRRKIWILFHLLLEMKNR